MRNKIKQLLNKEEGFTLVELLAVLAILAIIVGIAIPMVGNVVSSSRVKANDAQVDLILDAARLYETEKGVKADNVGQLTEGATPYLEEDVINEDSTKGLVIGKDTTIEAIKGMKSGSVTTP